MYKSRLPKNLTSTLAGVYLLSGGTSSRTSEALQVSLYDTFAVQVGYVNEVGTPKLLLDIEGSTDGTNWSVIKRVTDVAGLTDKRVVYEHVTAWVRVKLSITSGTSIDVTWVTVEAIT